MNPLQTVYTINPLWTVETRNPLHKQPLKGHIITTCTSVYTNEAAKTARLCFKKKVISSQNSAPTLQKDGHFCTSNLQRELQMKDIVGHSFMSAHLSCKAQSVLQRVCLRHGFQVFPHVLFHQLRNNAEHMRTAPRHQMLMPTDKDLEYFA